MSEVKYDINFLENKGFFEKKSKEIINGKEIFIDPKNAFAYVEVHSIKEVEKFKSKIKENFERIRYIWFYFPVEEKIKVYRSIGELKWFYYDPKRDRRETKKSKESNLNKFSKDNINILFDVKAVVNEFYNKIWRIRIDIARSIKDLKEDGNKLLVSQKFIDRMIFFYFLAQLGLVKIRNEEVEWKLDKTHTKEFFEWIIARLKSDYKVLEFMNRIFFDVLSKINSSGWSKAEFKVDNEQFFVIAPSLDGGLFMEEEFEGKKEGRIKFKGAKKLIELLNQYNWIIGEEIPQEDRIGDLTPEIIGHIYEKVVVSLEQMGTDLKKIKLSDLQTTKEGLRLGRKKIGAYYTPEEITNYISMNTIYPYIQDRIYNKFKIRYKNIQGELLKRESFTKKELKIIKYLYFEILTKIKICDNACGSGSFLIAAGDVLLRLYSKVLKILKDNLSEDKDIKEILKQMRKTPSRNYYIVRQIIVNNLYGVDIMEGAIEIARLRFWLWLISQVDPEIVEGKRIETLPNLDFNLMVGNSLIGFIDIEDTEFDFIPIKTKKRWETLTEKQVLITTWTEKERIEWLKELAKRKQEFKTLPTHEATKLKEKLNKELGKARKFLNEKFYNMLKSKGINISKQEFWDLKPFHWGFEFYEAFDLEKPKEERGFDVIIGNPPYISNKQIEKTEKIIHPIIFKSCTGQYDYLVLFIENSIKILNRFGRFGYITSNKFLASEYGYGIRRILFEQVCLTKIIDVSNYQVFRGIATYPILLFFKNIPCAKGHLFIGKANEGELENNRVRGVTIEKMIFSYLTDSYVITTSINKNNVEIMKFLSKFEKLGKGVISCGIAKAGFSRLIKKYDQLNVKQRMVAKRILQSEDIDRFIIKYEDKWILPSVTNRQQWSGFNDNKIVMAGIGLNIRASYDTEKSALGRVYYLKESTIRKKINMDPKTLLVILNSRIIDFYFSILYVAVHQAGGYLRYNAPYLSTLPIKLPPTQQPFIILADYMLFLNATEERRTKEKELIEFIDREIIDFLVYELYFKEKFEEDGIKTNLLELVEPYLKDISNLNSDEQKLQTIKKVVEKIKNDKRVMGQMEKIKSHPWVRVIEGCER